MKLCRGAATLIRPQQSPFCTLRTFSHKSIRSSIGQDHAILKELILEILHAQPSLRDSKSYLKSFAPKAGDSSKKLGKQPVKNQLRSFPFQSAHSGITSHLPQHGPPPPAPQPEALASSSSLFRPQRVNSNRGVEAQATEQAQRLKVNRDESDSHNFAEADTTSVSTSTSIRDKGVSTAESDLDQESTASEMLPSVPMQQHIALVKIQGPFTSRQLDSIADGMVYLKRLGLVSVIVIDSEESAWEAASSRFNAHDGRRMESENDQESNELAPWMTPKRAARDSASAVVGKVQEVLRKQMLQEVAKLSELLTQKGAPARPFSHAVMRIDAERVALINEVYPPSLTGRAAAQAYQWAVDKPSTDRSPLVSDDSLISIRKALENDMIPVIAPLALYEDPDGDKAPRTVCVSANDTLVGLAREMSAHGRHHTETAGVTMDAAIDLMPLRLMVINREGGIPSHARGGNPHLSINLASEYSHVANSFIWDESHPTALSNLSMVRDCLAYMPQTSSGVVVSHRSPKSLIGNLITNKAAHSPSLPHRLLAGRKDVRHTPTIVRPGLDIRVVQDYDAVDWDKMTTLLEASFGRNLDADAYYSRLRHSLDFVIVTGDYEGAAIVTNEYAPGEDATTHEAVAYLDKFAVLPSLQGSGAVDFLWGALRDEVHGLGLLDALNDNGGKGGFGKGRDLVWKSRSNNPVNKWYYERSNGFIKIDTNSEASSSKTQAHHSPAWAMFWCDAEERVATMSGERRLAAEASREDILSMAREGVISRDVQRALDSEEDHPSLHDFTNRDKGTNTLLGEMNHLNKLLPSNNLQRLLPVIAPDEQGRLQRWAKCMSTIPSAWK